MLAAALTTLLFFPALLDLPLHPRHPFIPRNLFIWRFIIETLSVSHIFSMWVPPVRFAIQDSQASVRSCLRLSDDFKVQRLASVKYQPDKGSIKKKHRILTISIETMNWRYDEETIDAINQVSPPNIRARQ